MSDQRHSTARAKLTVRVGAHVSDVREETNGKENNLQSNVECRRGGGNVNLFGGLDNVLPPLARDNGMNHCRIDAV
jgi:hypothetical protein